MSHKIYDNLDVRGTVTAEAPASTGAYRIMVFNTASKKFESVDPSEIGGGGLAPGCYAACGIVQGLNYSQPNDFLEGVRYWLRYRVGNDDAQDGAKTENVVEESSEEIQYPFFAGKQPGYLYVTAELVINNKFYTDSPVPFISPRALALVVAVNGYVVFAKTISPPEISAYLASNPVGPWIIPFEAYNTGDAAVTPNIYGPEWGYVTLILTEINSDTNAIDMGILAMGQDILFTSDTTTFTSQVQAVGGGMSSEAITISKEFPVSPEEGIPERPFSWKQYGSEAGSGNLIITGQNDEAVPLYVQVVSSLDPTLWSYEEVLPGNSYSKTVPLTLAQLQDNDFYVNVTQVSPEPPEED